ncbi:TetR/AcrR family transcriptional regulator [Falsibacillus albus]|uniref:TetR/AcrR family transcriptional regulator n=1 Tax=Falsibacillus albus TaxID=2478915 RepID=UPI0013144CCB|nr:TetR/AcrR family transcriptional regulator [Falsibacillus albus]
MSVTKEQILRSANYLFAKRGFPSTSIQDIADDCGIAKGSVYKHFPSKEELFNEVFERSQNRFFEEVEEVVGIQDLPAKERFTRQIIFRFQFFLENKYIFIDYQEIPIEQNPKFVPLRMKTRARFMNWHRECLMNVYGDAIENHLSDLVILYKAMLREYLFWILDENQPLSIEDTAEFIVDKVDLLAQHFIEKETQPLIKNESLEHFYQWGMSLQNKDKEEVMKSLLKHISLMITELPTGNMERSELNEITSLISAELGRTKPNIALLKSLLSYLAKERALRSTIKQLENVLSI